MPTVLIEYPKERWRKVNISKFLSKFDKLNVSAAVRVSEKDLDRLLSVLKRNNCKVIVTHEESRERRIIEKILESCTRIRNRQASPDEIGNLATKTIAEIGLEKLSAPVRDILQLAIEFSEDHNLLTLNELEDETKEYLSLH
jgi:hypothetical protein